MPDKKTKPPTGTVTFLFTDIVGSTEMWETHGDAFLPILQAHNAILMDAIERYGGYLMKTEGDAYKVAFADPAAAINCAVLAQAALQRYPWPDHVGGVRVRMSVHTGEPFMQAGDYFGPPLNRTSRIQSAAHGGQIMISEDTMSHLDQRGPREARFIDLGHHQLKDLEHPLRLFQVTHPTILESNFPPPRTLNGHANNLPVQRPSFIGREKEIEQIAAILTREDTPFLTLTGPQGIGKTRLSLQVAAERIELFPDGVWFVRLTNASDLQGAALEVAQTLGITIPEGREPLEVVREWVANRRCLLILDDCGQLPQAATFIREMLEGASSLRCVATSQQSLQLGEEVELGSLSMPEENADVQGVLNSESGQLFVNRAFEQDASFELNERRSKPISRLLRQLKFPGSILQAAEQVVKERVSPVKMERLGKQILQGAGAFGQAAASSGRDLLERLRQSADLAALLGVVNSSVEGASILAQHEQKCRDALVIYQRIEDRAGAADMLRQLGNIAYAQRDYSRAVTLLSAAHQTYGELGRPESLSVRADLEQAYKALGSHEHHERVPLAQAVEVAMRD